MRDGGWFIPGLDGVTPPLAGIEGSTRRAFLIYDFVDSLLWIALYVGLGYLFAERLTIIAASMARFGRVIAAGIEMPIMCYAGWRVWITIHMLRHLRLRRITPLLLNGRMASGEQIAIVDPIGFRI
jgi:membrane protein DedA with SNARE-associated domain